MAQDYDKVWKENIGALIPVLARKLLNIEADQMDEINFDLQKTIERRPDFLRKVIEKVEKPDDAYILHIEFQSANDEAMHFRMLEYFALIRRKYRLKVHQYVIYIGDGLSKMENTLSEEKLEYVFDIISLQSISYKEFVQSEMPEEIILAILANFDNQKPRQVATELLMQLNTIPTETIRKEKCVKQLEILSNLRNLQSIIIELIPKIMALEYDIKKDIRYQQGIEQGIEIGEQKGEQKKTDKGIENALKQDLLNVEQIAELFEVNVEYVLEIKSKLNL